MQQIKKPVKMKRRPLPTQCDLWPPRGFALFVLVEETETESGLTLDVGPITDARGKPISKVEKMVKQELDSSEFTFKCLRLGEPALDKDRNEIPWEVKPGDEVILQMMWGTSKIVRADPFTQEKYVFVVCKEEGIVSFVNHAYNVGVK